MRKLFSSIVLVALVAFMFAACATRYDSRGVYHKVRKGETLQSIAEYYNAKPEDIARLNFIDSDTPLTKGQKIYLGGAKHPDKVAKVKKGKKFAYKGLKGQFDKPLALEDVKLSWPTNGVVYSSFGIRHGRRHDGMDISAKSGTPINAAADGMVVFNGYMRGYGNILIMQHGKRVFTTYAHNQDNLVNEGDVVKKGDLIAYVGSTGRSTGPHVHFEIRYGADAKNPILYLPLETDEHRALYAAAKESASKGHSVASKTLGGSKSSHKAYANRLRDKKNKDKAKSKDKDSKQLAKKDDKKNKNAKNNKKQTIASRNKAGKQVATTSAKTKSTTVSTPQSTDVAAKTVAPAQSPMQKTKKAIAKKAADKNIATKNVATQTAPSADKTVAQPKVTPKTDKVAQQKQPAKKQQTVAKKGDAVKKTAVSKKVASKPAVKKSTATAKATPTAKKPGDLATRKAPAAKTN